MPNYKHPMNRNAIISDCGRYRYTLDRSGWPTIAGAKPAVFVMLNPSTADAYREDNTIRRCIGFARSWGRPLTVVNLFAFRSTNPQGLLLADDPIGPDNIDYIRSVVCDRDPEDDNPMARPLVVCGWGTFLSNNKKCPRPDIPLMQMFRDWGVEPMCLGRTHGGFPRHPLYTQAGTLPVPYSGPKCDGQLKTDDAREQAGRPVSEAGRGQ